MIDIGHDDANWCSDIVKKISQNPGDIFIIEEVQITDFKDIRY
jgi:hypothetical protein